MTEQTLCERCKAIERVDACSYGMALAIEFVLDGIFAFAALVYASIVPLNYTPRTWDEAYERFGNLRWLNLNVYRRCRLVANGIVALPFSFFLAGAADRARRFSFAYFAWSILIVSCGMIGIAAIEFLQIWYPPRTISGNDVAAGCIGVLLGPIAWSLGGRPAYTDGCVFAG